MNKCILHIGSEKTGSTALQHFLNKNRENMHDYYYSKSLGECNNYLLPLAFCDNYVLNKDIFELEHIDLISNYESRKKEIISNFKIERMNHNNENWIISSEHLSSRILKQSTLEKIKKLLTELGFKEIIVTIYLRNIYEYTYSSYYTYLETGGNAEFTEYICSPYNIRNSNYYNIIKMWSDVFEKVDIHLYKKGMNIIPDFIREYDIRFKKNPEIDLSINNTKITEIKNLNEILICKPSNLFSIEYKDYENFMSKEIKELIYSLFYPSLKILGKNYFNDRNTFI